MMAKPKETPTHSFPARGNRSPVGVAVAPAKTTRTFLKLVFTVAGALLAATFILGEGCRCDDNEPAWSDQPSEQDHEYDKPDPKPPPAEVVPEKTDPSPAPKKGRKSR